jgi:hypothetical protein
VIKSRRRRHHHHHHHMVIQMIMLSLESYKISFLIYDWNQNHNRDLSEHTGLFSVWLATQDTMTYYQRCFTESLTSS